jgi:hypothetical protein
MSYTNIFNFWWDIFIIFLAVYNSITFPLVMAFPHFAKYYENPDDGKPSAMFFVENAVDAIFVIDIILIFFTTYMDTRLGDEIYNPK